MVPRGTATRAERSAASLMAAAVAVISSKGRKARWTIPYPPKAARRMKAGRVTTAMNTRLVTVWGGFRGLQDAPDPQAALPPLGHPEVQDVVLAPSPSTGRVCPFWKGSEAVKDTGTCPASRAWLWL